MTNHLSFKSFLLPALSLCLFSAQGGEIIPYPQALEEAKSNKKTIVVVSDGSDWLPVSPQLNTTYKAVANKLTALDKSVIWAIHDEKNTLPKDRKSVDSQIIPPMKVWNYPAVQILDSEGRPLYFEEGIAPSRLEKLDTVIPKIEDLRKKRDSFFEKAAQSTGQTAVDNIAKGLILLDDKIVQQGSYKNLIERIKKEDPKDQKGYYFRFTYKFLPFIEGTVNKQIGEKKFKEAYAAIDEKLKLPALTTYQKQALLAAKFRVARESNDLKTGLGFLKQSVMLDPKSELGQGCAYMASYYTQPVKLKGLRWLSTDNRPVWLPMIADASSVVKGSGKYKIEFKHQGGHTKFRNPAFKTSSGRVLASLSDNKESREFFLDLPSGGGKIILEVEAQGTGWFDGRGDIIITKQ